MSKRVPLPLCHSAVYPLSLNYVILSSVTLPIPILYLYFCSLLVFVHYLCFSISYIMALRVYQDSLTHFLNVHLMCVGRLRNLRGPHFDSQAVFLLSAVQNEATRQRLLSSVVWMSRKCYSLYQYFFIIFMTMSCIFSSFSWQCLAYFSPYFQHDDMFMIFLWIFIS